jgi:hypothetical protein
LDAIALEKVILGLGMELRFVVPSVQKAASSAFTELEHYSSEPTDARRLKAFEKVMSLRNLIQRIPRSVVLP